MLIIGRCFGSEGKIIIKESRQEVKNLVKSNKKDIFANRCRSDGECLDMSLQLVFIKQF